MQSAVIEKEVAVFKCHSKTYSKLVLITFDQSLHDKSSNYWFAVRFECRSHIAFANRNALLTWLTDLNLSLERDLPADGEFSVQGLKGSYKTCLWNCAEGFNALRAQARETRVMSNAEYTVGLITEDAAGIKCVHTLNSGVPGFKLFDYKESHGRYW